MKKQLRLQKEKAQLDDNVTTSSSGMKSDMLRDDDKGDNSSIATTTNIAATNNTTTTTQVPVKKEVKLITRVTELLKAGCGGGILAESSSMNEEFNHTRICMGLHSGLNILKSSVMTTAGNDGVDGNDDAEYDLLLHPGDMMTLRKCNGNLGIVLVPIEEKQSDGDDANMMKMKMKKTGNDVEAVIRDGDDSRKDNSENKDNDDNNNKIDNNDGKVISENDTVDAATELNARKGGDNTDNVGESKKDDKNKESNFSAENNEDKDKNNINDDSSSSNNNNSSRSSSKNNNEDVVVINNNELMETSKDKANIIKNIEVVVVKKKLRSEVQCFEAKVPRGEWTHLAFIATTTPNNRLTLYMVGKLVRIGM